MKRMLAVALILALLLSGVGVFAEDDIRARTSIYGLDWEKLSNLQAAVERIDGTLVPGGSSFSFNAIVGPCTQSNGFCEAANGRGVITLGGGIEQAATTLYLALNQLGGDVYFDEKHSYGERFADGYVSDGDNAILVDEPAGKDFVFTNLGGDMEIGMYLSGDGLYCTLSVAPAYSEGFLNWTGPGPQLRTPVASAQIELEGTQALIDNVTLAAQSINDAMFSTGDLFSFNDLVGPRTERHGYKSALNGRGKEVVGGGVAIVASGIWLAVKDLDGVAIVQKSTYGERYNQHYVSSSNDAILTDYTSNIDFSFRNKGEDPLTIATWVRDDVLYCEIYRG